MTGFLEQFFPETIGKESTQAGDLYCTYNNQKIQWFTSSLFLAGAAHRAVRHHRSVTASACCTVTASSHGTDCTVVEQQPSGAPQESAAAKWPPSSHRC